MTQLDSAFAFFGATGLVFELLISVALFTGGLAKRPQFAARVGLSVTLLVAVAWGWSAVLPSTMWNDIARFLLIISLVGLAIALCWRLAPHQALFYVVVAAVLQHFAFRGALIVTSLLHNFFPSLAVLPQLAYPWALLPFYAIGYAAFARPLRTENTETIDNRAIVLLLAGMLLFVNVFTAVFNELAPTQSGGLFAVFSLLDLVTCIFLLSLTTQMVRRASAEQNSEILHHLLRQQKVQLESSRETIELINVKTHDLKQQISLLGDRIPRDEVSELQNLVGIYDSLSHTGNEPLDVLLAQKSLICERRGIRFDRVVDGELLEFMKPGDVYSLFGNAIDNAIEAVDTISDPERRYISMKVRRSKGMLAIHIENPVDGTPQFVNGLPQTTKDDARYHGFGMLSIRMIVEKYEGFLSVSATDGLFSVTALLPFIMTGARTVAED